jgi:hypothetical protein
MSALGRVVEERPAGAAYVLRVVSEAPRTLHDTSVVIRTDTVLERRAAPLEAPPPEFLARNGFIEPRISILDLPIYHAPTPEIIVSERFIETHCFRGTEHPDHPWVGLLFEPAPGVETADVRGIVWVDTLSGNAQRIEFEYTRLADFLERHEWRYALQESGHAMYWQLRRAFQANRSLGGPQARGLERAPIHVPRRLFGGVVNFGHPGTGGWDVVDWEIHWPALRGGVIYSHTERTGRPDHPVWRNVMVEFRIVVPYYTAAEVVEVRCAAC